MIKGFMTKSALLDYINHELYYGRNKFVFELIDNINYLTSKYQEYKAKVYKALYDKFDDDKYGILFISKIAEEALKPTEVKPLDIHDRDSEYTNEEIIKLYNDYLEIAHKSTIYFTRIHTISFMFSAMGYDCDQFPEVLGIITGTYNGKNNGYDRKELQTKFFNMILDLNNNFDDEWVKLNKFDLYKLK
jgi:hypothetical protein